MEKNPSDDLRDGEISDEGSECSLDMSDHIFHADVKRYEIMLLNFKEEDPEAESESDSDSDSSIDRNINKEIFLNARQEVVSNNKAEESVEPEKQSVVMQTYLTVGAIHDYFVKSIQTGVSETLKSVHFLSELFKFNIVVSFGTMTFSVVRNVKPTSETNVSQASSAECVLNNTDECKMNFKLLHEISRSLKEKVLLKETSFTLEEIQKCFSQSNQTGSIVKLYSTTYKTKLFSTYLFKLIIFVSDENLNVLVTKQPIITPKKDIIEKKAVVSKKKMVKKMPTIPIIKDNAKRNVSGETLAASNNCPQASRRSFAPIKVASSSRAKSAFSKLVNHATSSSDEEEKATQSSSSSENMTVQNLVNGVGKRYWPYSYCSAIRKGHDNIPDSAYYATITNYRQRQPDSKRFEGSKCKTCDYKAMSPYDLEIHQNLEHSIKKNVKYPTFKNKINFDFRHQKDPCTSKHYKCLLCNDFSTNTNFKLQTHMLKSHTTKSVHTCNQCMYNETDFDKFQKHMSTLHSIKEPFKCHCKYSTWNFDEMNQHKKRCPERYRCGVCNYKTPELSCIQFHYRNVHPTEKPNH